MRSSLPVWKWSKVIIFFIGKDKRHVHDIETTNRNLLSCYQVRKNELGDITNAFRVLTNKFKHLAVKNPISNPTITLKNGW